MLFPGGGCTQMDSCRNKHEEITVGNNLKTQANKD